MHIGSPASDLVTILQPYVPRYRVPLFQDLASRLERHGLRLQVATPAPRGAQAARNDSASARWHVPIPERRFDFCGHELRHRASRSLAVGSAVVVAELASSNLDTYALAARHAERLIVWGHGRDYVTPHNRLDGALERWLAHRAAHVLVYTSGGRDRLVSRGIEMDKLTVLENSSDTVALRAESDRLAAHDLDGFRVRTDLENARIGLFVGALDESKRLDLLLEASATVNRAMPEFRLVIAGDGPLRAEVNAAVADRSDVRLLPHADQRTLALLGGVADVCLMPGRVGLVAVDAMTLGLPVITTAWPFHAPEREYLTDSFCWVAPDDPLGYAETVLSVMSDRARLSQASRDATSASFGFSIEEMAQRMSDAIVRVAQRPNRSS